MDTGEGSEGRAGTLADLLDGDDEVAEDRTDDNDEAADADDEAAEAGSSTTDDDDDPDDEHFKAVDALVRAHEGRSKGGCAGLVARLDRLLGHSKGAVPPPPDPGTAADDVGDL